MADHPRVSPFTLHKDDPHPWTRIDVLPRTTVQTTCVFGGHKNISILTIIAVFILNFEKKPSLKLHTLSGRGYYNWGGRSSKITLVMPSHVVAVCTQLSSWIKTSQCYFLFTPGVAELLRQLQVRVQSQTGSPPVPRRGKTNSHHSEPRSLKSNSSSTQRGSVCPKDEELTTEPPKLTVLLRDAAVSIVTLQKSSSVAHIW